MGGESTSPIGNLWKNLLRSFDQELHHYSLWYNQSSSCYIFSWCCIHSLTPRPLIGPPWNVAFDLSPEQLIQLSSWSGLLNLKKICVFSLKFKGKMKEILSIINHTCTFKPVYTYIICFWLNECWEFVSTIIEQFKHFLNIPSFLSFLFFALSLLYVGNTHCRYALLIRLDLAYHCQMTYPKL